MSWLRLISLVLGGALSLVLLYVIAINYAVLAFPLELLSIAAIICLSIMLSRSVNRSNYLENIFEQMDEQLGTFTKFCEIILNKPTYSNEPIVMTLLNEIKGIYEFLSQVEAFYTYDLELEATNVEPEEMAIPLESSDGREQRRDGEKPAE